jgi:hypothetical protein
VRIAKDNRSDDRIFRISLVAVSLIPTVFLWSSIGLRESFLYASISAILFTLNRIRLEPKWYWYLALGFALFSLSQTKSYIFVIMQIAVVLAALIDTARIRRIQIVHLVIIALTLTPLLVNPTLAEAIASGGKAQLIAVVTEVPETNQDTNPDTNPESLVASRGMTVHALVDQLKSDPESLISRIAIKLGITSKLEASSKSSVVVAGGEEDQANKAQLSLKKGTLTSLSSLLQSISRFLFVPFIFVDNGSLFLNIQSIETPVWLFIYVIFFVTLYLLFRSRREVDFVVTAAIVFVVEFILLSALTEINVGTALRHRSLLLIPILVIWVARKKTPASI